MAFRAGRDRPRSAAEWRAEWAQAGVLCDALSCNVLTLGLQPVGEGAVARSLRLLAQTGEPAVLTLRQLTRERLTFAAEPVFVCENPAVVNPVAEALGVGTRPLVCAAGWPNTAVSALLDRLAACGCNLRYQSDFDAEGTRIAEYMHRRHKTASWRFDTATYASTVDARGHEIGPSVGDAASVMDAIETIGVPLYEEDIVELLITDLRVPNASAARGGEHAVVPGGHIHARPR